jgi:poly(hydroxyalkanoate) depolymerase family esterase
MIYRKCTIFLVAACALLGLAGLWPGNSGAAAPPGSLVQEAYTNGAGTLPYAVYIPSTYVAGTQVPLIVALHGCTQSAERFRQLTRFDELAEQKNFIVVFPEQPSDANRFNCWNFFSDAHMKRGAGEPSMLAGIAQTVRDQYNVDPHRIYVAGLSAGGAMATVLSVTYPDIFAASGVQSGCEYAATAACAGYKSADPEAAARQAYAAMGSNARIVPAIILQGDKDKTVPPVNGKQLVQQWLATDDWVDDGSRNHSIPAWPAGVRHGAVPNGRSYTVSNYSDGHGRTIVQYWLVHGMEHAWSGGCACQPHSDPSGPDASSAMYDFFMSHPAP